MARLRRVAIFAVTYTGISLAVEIVLMVGVGLRPPRDNAILGPIILTVPPILTALLFGYREPSRLALAAVALSLFTLAVTVTVVRITGMAVGLVEPIISRSVAGLLAGWMIAALTRRMSSSENVSPAN